MAKRKNEVEETGEQSHEGTVPEQVTTAEEVEVADLVYDIDSLWKMKFRDPVDGTITMVRKAFKPRGKLEFYAPRE